jgi:hypothetical protein
MKKKLFFILSIVILFLLFFSCRKEKKPTELILGQYNLTAVSIDGEDVLDLLINDSINMHTLAIYEESHPFIFYISPDQGVVYIYLGHYKLLSNYTVLQIKTNSWGGAPDYFLNNNLAILPFSQQEIINSNIISLTESELIFETTYLEKNYRYAFKK